MLLFTLRKQEIVGRISQTNGHTSIEQTGLTKRKQKTHVSESK